MNAMAIGSLPPCIAFQRVQLRRFCALISPSRGSRGRLGCLRRVNLSIPGVRRTLITAVTSSPTILNKYPDDTQPPPTILPSIVDAGLAWASQAHNAADPPAHAVILISKALIPRGQGPLLEALGQSNRLCGLNALVGVVDTVGEGAKGVSVLLASRSEGITIDTLKGVQTEALRVGKWHASDVEKDESINFDEVLASIRGRATAIAARPDPSATEDLVFVLGEMEALNSQATTMNQKFPSADIVGITLARTPTINSLFTTLVHNGVVIPSTNVMLFRIARKQDREYVPPNLEHNISWFTNDHVPTITRYSGNLILELDNSPAMPYLLSLLPHQSQEEKLNPIPLVARLPSRANVRGSLYLNVLGGSQSRGGIALDPLVSSDRLFIGAKVEFGQLRQVYLPTFRPPPQGVHIQLEVLSHVSRRYAPGWKTITSKYNQMIQVGFQRQQRWTDNPEFTVNRRLDYQGIKKRVFSAGSEGGFLVGERGVIPWLCRTRGSRVQLQATAHEKGQRRKAFASRPQYPVDTEAYLAQIERKIKLRQVLRERNLIISKKVVFLDDKRWITIPVLRKRVPGMLPAVRRGREKMETHNRAAQRKKKQRLEKRREELALQIYEGRLRMWKARDRLQEALPQFKDAIIKHPGPKVSLRKKKESDKTSKLSSPSVQLKPSQSFRRKARLDSLSPYLRGLLMSDLNVQSILTSGALDKMRFFDGRRGDFRGPKKFDFRARMSWSHFRPSGFRRSDHRPGGFKLWKTNGKGKEKHAEARRTTRTGDSAKTEKEGETVQKETGTSGLSTIEGSKNARWTGNASKRIAAGRKEKETGEKGADSNGLLSTMETAGERANVMVRIADGNEKGGGGKGKREIANSRKII